MIGRSQGHLAATACVLAFGACSDPEQSSGLRPDGPPEILSVLVANDTDGIAEEATFCKMGDSKRPGLVPANPLGPSQVCPANLSDGVPEAADVIPSGWYVRLMFDELLNPDIEDLIELPGGGLFGGSLMRSQPVTLTCNGVNVNYSGYYNPSGNNISWALGPSLFIQPLMFFPDPALPADTPLEDFTVPSGSTCQVSIKPDVIVDKDGNKVPVDQRGPYGFKLAAMAFVASAPAHLKDRTKPVTLKTDTPVVIRLNAPVKDGSLTPAEVTLLEVADCAATTGTPHPAVITVDPDDPQAFDIAQDDDGSDTTFWQPGKTFSITFSAGANVEDVAGGPAKLPGAADLFICFKTGT
jgi:hypothetical protein